MPNGTAIITMSDSLMRSGRRTSLAPGEAAATAACTCAAGATS